MKHIRRVLALVLLAMMVVTMASAEVNADVTNFTGVEQLDQILATNEIYYGDLGTMTTDAAVKIVEGRTDFEKIKAKCQPYAKSTDYSIFYIGKFVATNSGNRTAYVAIVFNNGQFNQTSFNMKNTIGTGVSIKDCWVVTKALPKTGDETPVALLCVLLAGAAAGIIALRRRQAQGACCTISP